MSNLNLSAYIVPSDDEGRLRWVSGFTGSEGKAIVTINKAALWIDGRYTIQAKKQVDQSWNLMQWTQAGIQNQVDWLTSQRGAYLGKGSFVGADPALISAQSWLDLKKRLESFDLKLVSVENFIDQLWTEQTGRPLFIPKTIVVHPLKFAGKSFEDKMSDLRPKILELGAASMVVSERDEIAWLFNLRGEGDPLPQGLLHSPTFPSLALVGQEEITIWLRTENLSPNVKQHLSPIGCQQTNTCVHIKDYDSSLKDLKDHENWTEKVLFTNKTLFAIYESIPESKVLFSESPLIVMKAVKNEAEVTGMMTSHIRDAVALAEFFSHLEEDITNGKQSYTEISASNLLYNYRNEQPFFKGISFETVSAFGPHGSMPHYIPMPETDVTIDVDNLYLVDSGGQYENGGTTDVTRTVHFGSPGSEHIEMYTRVLMGAIDLARLSVPDGTLDIAVDVIARQHLFEKNLNYDHSTGHGIGSYLEVHEGPISIYFTEPSGKFEKNFFFSDEPGYYKENEYGIRLETILRAVSKDDTKTTFGNFLRFEVVTLVPFEPKLIDFGMMSPPQIEWLNGYNEHIRKSVSSVLKNKGRDRAYQWTMSRTEYVDPFLNVKKRKQEF